MVTARGGAERTIAAAGGRRRGAQLYMAKRSSGDVTCQRVAAPLFPRANVRFAGGSSWVAPPGAATVNLSTTSWIEKPVRAGPARVRPRRAAQLQ